MSTAVELQPVYNHTINATSIPFRSASPNRNDTQAGNLPMRQSKTSVELLPNRAANLSSSLMTLKREKSRDEPSLLKERMVGSSSKGKQVEMLEDSMEDLVS